MAKRDARIDPATVALLAPTYVGRQVFRFVGDDLRSIYICSVKCGAQFMQFGGPYGPGMNCGVCGKVENK